MEAVEQFRELVARPAWQLDEAALAIAAGADPRLQTRRWLDELDRLAGGVTTFDTLVRRLFVAEGFTGNGERYYDARNSLLHLVLARRLGLPITLAIVAIEVGRRAGVALEGVGMPGHFLVRRSGTEQYVDAFAGGEVLDLAGCEDRFRQTTRARIPFGEHLLPTAAPPAILARVLANLQNVYRQTRRPADLEWALRMRMCLPGSGVDEVFELGSAIGGQGRWHEAAVYLEAERERWPAHRDRLGAAARAERSHLN